MHQADLKGFKRQCLFQNLAGHAHSSPSIKSQAACSSVPLAAQSSRIHTQTNRERNIPFFTQNNFFHPYFLNKLAWRRSKTDRNVALKLVLLFSNFSHFFSIFFHIFFSPFFTRPYNVRQEQGWGLDGGLLPAWPPETAPGGEAQAPFTRIPLPSPSRGHRAAPQLCVRGEGPRTSGRLPSTLPPPCGAWL